MSRKPCTRTLALASALALAAGTGTLLAASTALAETGARATAVVGTDGKVRYTADEGQTNSVTITWELGTDNPSGWADYIFTIRDKVKITAGNGCVHPSETDLSRVVCTTTEPSPSSDEESLIADLRDRDDRLTVSEGTNAGVRVFGGTGHDILLGGGDDLLYGQDGNDRLDGGGLQFGGAGDDTISGGGARGGSGNDTLIGDNRSNALYGDSGNDKIYGNTGHDALYGGKGKDLIYGGEGRDTIYGNSGADSLHGGIGTDKLYGGADDDRLYGDAGPDLLHGGSGRDTLDGGTGDDVLRQY